MSHCKIIIAGGVWGCFGSHKKSYSDYDVAVKN